MKKLLLPTLLIILFCSTLAQGQPEPEIIKVEHFYPKLKPGAKDMAEVKEVISKGFSKWNIYDITTDENWTTATIKDILFLDDRIEVVFKKESKAIYFSDMIDYSIESTTTKKEILKDGKSIFIVEEYVYLGNLRFDCHYDYIARDLMNNLFILQQQLIEKRNSQLAVFEPIAAKYREMNVKPPVQEAQRKFIVQANSFNQKKEYFKALEIYKKAIDLDQTAYPAAYSNLALISAQIHNFDSAIYYMKKYLLLEPEAVDARSGQDKIYEWEGELGK